MTYQHLIYFMAMLILGSAQDVRYFLQGQEIRLVPSIFGKPKALVWMHDGNEVVVFNGMVEHVFPQYENRASLDRASAELTIKNITYEDSGEYDLEVLINERIPHFNYRVEVIDKVSKPSISCETSDTNQVTLVCSTESKQPHLLDFKWSSRGNEQTGPNVTITVRNEDDDQVYRCDVRNPLTNQMASFTVKDCFLDQRSAAQLTVVIFVILMVVIMMGCVFYRKCRPLQASFENVCNRRQNAFKGSKQGDETIIFLVTPPTLPSNERPNEEFRSESDVKTPTELEDIGNSANGRREDDSHPTLVHRRVEGMRRNTWPGDSSTGDTMKKVTSYSSLKEEDTYESS